MNTSWAKSLLISLLLPSLFSVTGLAAPQLTYEQALAEAEKMRSEVLALKKDFDRLKAGFDTIALGMMAGPASESLKRPMTLPSTDEIAGAPVQSDRSSSTLTSVHNKLLWGLDSLALSVADNCSA